MTATVRTTQHTYPAYKDSGIEWLGEIPEHWGVQRLKFVAQVQPSNVDKKSDEAELPVLLCNYSDVYNNECITADIDFMSATATPAEIKKFSIAEGDVIITKDSESPYDIAVPAYVAETIENTLCGYHLTHIRPESLIGKYLFRLFQCSKFNAQFTVGANGVTRFGLPQYVVSNAAIPLPPLPEQEAIARFLDHKTAQIDALIAKKEALLARLADKRTALISQAVTQGLDPTVPMRDSGIEWLGEIPEHWEIKKAKYLTDILRGKFTHRPRNDPRLYDGEYPFIQTGDVASADMYIRSYSQTLNDEGFKVSKQFPHGTLVMTIAANIGDIAILNFAACFPDSIVGFVPKPSVDLFYLYYMFVAMRQQLLLTAVLNTQLNLNVERIANQFCVLPPISQQLEIVEFLNHSMTKLESLAVNIEHAINKLKQYRTALITNAVTGKIDVREAGSWATQASMSS